MAKAKKVKPFTAHEALKKLAWVAAELSMTNTDKLSRDAVQKGLPEHGRDFVHDPPVGADTHLKGKLIYALLMCRAHDLSRGVRVDEARRKRQERAAVKVIG